MTETRICDECGISAVSTKWCDHGRIACEECRNHLTTMCRYCANGDKE